MKLSEKENRLNIFVVDSLDSKILVRTPEKDIVYGYKGTVAGVPVFGEVARHQED